MADMTSRLVTLCNSYTPAELKETCLGKCTTGTAVQCTVLVLDELAGYITVLTGCGTH